jgi:ATP-dependent Lhr-like helicase
MNAAELGKRQFRGIARVAGLVLQGYPGKKKTARALQVSAGLLYDVFSKYDPDNLLLAQAQRELLERQLEIGRLRDTLGRMAAGKIVRLHTARLTPLAFPLWADRISQDSVNPEGHAKRLERMLAELERAAARKDALEFKAEEG